MAIVHTHLIPLEFMTRSHPDFRTVTYGECTEPPFVTEGLHFVSFIHDTSSDCLTVFVPQEYVNPATFNEMANRKDKWEKVALYWLTGDFNPDTEMLWKDQPLQQHTFKNGVHAKYGPCRSVPQEQPWRKLGFITIEQSDGFFSGLVHATIVVDIQFLTPEYIEQVGSDYRAWGPYMWNSYKKTHPGAEEIELTHMPSPKINRLVEKGT